MPAMATTSEQPQRRYILELEGNVGAGRSSLLRALETRLQEEKLLDQFIILLEPVELWRNVGGVDLLTKYYEAPSRWAFALETYILTTLVDRNHLAKNHLTPHCILERSGRATSEVFKAYVASTGLMNRVESATFDSIWRLLCPQLNDSSRTITRTIYLRTPPSICLQRLNQRGSEVEYVSNNCTLEWMTALHKLHDKWLLPSTSPDYILDGSKSIDELLNELMTILHSLPRQ